MRTPPTLRSQLLLFVGGPLCLLMLIETTVSYRIGLHAANLVFDRWLLDSVTSLTQEVRYRDGALHFDADPETINILEWDDLDDIYYQVSTPDGELIAGSRLPLPFPDLAVMREGPRFGNTRINGNRVRAVSVMHLVDGRHPVLVTVAETLRKRQSLSGDLLGDVLFANGLLLLGMLVTIRALFNRGLRPISRLNLELQHRSPQDLTPIAVGQAPLELRGLVENTNRLLSRIDAAITSRKQFIGNISHQIRTPIAGIKLQAQLAQEEDDPAEIQAALSRISRAADQMAHVNSQFMNLARAEAAFDSLRQDSVDLAALVRQCCADLEPRALARNIRLVLDVADTPVTIRGEATLLTEMVSNLVENAILYGRSGGHVWIHLGQGEGGPVLVVEDDGPGIAREHWPNIFDRFFRPNPAMGEGCGLGLAIVHEIALAHEAAVSLEEREGGTGTRFVVRFGMV